VLVSKSIFLQDSAMDSPRNINTKEYWESRFISGDWQAKAGRMQTANFAREQVSRLRIASSYSGTILDYGCGLGDAIPIYHKFFPHAQLIGCDISDSE